MKNTFLLLIAGLMVLLGTGCDSGSNPEGSNVEYLRINSPSGNRIDIDETLDLEVFAFNQFDQTIPLPTSPVWSSDSIHASINQNGLATGVSVGFTTIRVSAAGLEATFLLEVWDSSAPRTEIYVVDAGEEVGKPPFKILRFDENGKKPVIFTTQNLDWPQDMVFLESQGVVLVSNLNSGTISRHEIETGNYIDNFATGIGGPTRMKIGPDGLLYVLQWNGNGSVLRFEPDGTFVGEFTTVGVTQAIGLDWDADGNLYVSSFDAAHVRRFDNLGNNLGIFANTNLIGPTNIWIKGNELFVNDWNRGTVTRFDEFGNFENFFITGLQLPEGIAFMINGNFLIGNGGTGSVKMFDSDGNFIKDLIESGAGDLFTPNAVILREVNRD